MWRLEDNTKGAGGYLSILRDGVRVCDAFPFSQPYTKERQQFVRDQAQHIVDTMNNQEAAQSAE